MHHRDVMSYLKNRCSISLCIYTQYAFQILYSFKILRKNM